MRFLRQKTLEVSKSLLCLKDPVSIPPGETITAQLPNEILAMIFSYLPPRLVRCPYHDSGELTIPYVCKRWCWIYEAVLYRTLDTDQCWWDNPQKTLRLLHNLSYLHLAPYIREVNVTLRGTLRGGSSSIKTWKNVSRILSPCKRIRSASVFADFKPRAWPFLEWLAMQPLQRLSLSGYSGGAGLKLILDRFDLPTLQYLSLSSCGVYGQLAAVPELFLETSVDQNFLDQLLPPHRLYTGSVTTIVLKDPWTPADVTAHFLCWPRRLEQLTLESLRGSRYSDRYNLTSIQKLLDGHCKSLRRVKLGSFKEGTPDFSAFPCLEWLYVSVRQMRCVSHEDGFRKLVAPKLRFLNVRFDDEELDNLFSLIEADWFTDFAACSTDDTSNVSCLETIFIDFEPDFDESFDMEDLDVPWPWHYLEEAACRISAHGIKLAYTTPSCTREQWDSWKERSRLEMEGNAGDCGYPDSEVSDWGSRDSAEDDGDITDSFDEDSDGADGSEDDDSTI